MHKPRRTTFAPSDFLFVERVTTSSEFWALCPSGWVGTPHDRRHSHSASFMCEWQWHSYAASCNPRVATIVRWLRRMVCFAISFLIQTIAHFLFNLMRLATALVFLAVSRVKVAQPTQCDHNKPLFVQSDFDFAMPSVGSWNYSRITVQV